MPGGLMKALRAYLVGGLAATLIAYPWLAEYVHLARLARDGEPGARERLSDLIRRHPDRMALLHLLSRIFPLHLRIISELIKELGAEA